MSKLPMFLGRFPPQSCPDGCDSHLLGIEASELRRTNQDVSPQNDLSCYWRKKRTFRKSESISLYAV